MRLKGMQLSGQRLIGMRPNGMWPDGMRLKGFGSNGMRPNGMWPDGMRLKVLGSRERGLSECRPTEWIPEGARVAVVKQPSLGRPVYLLSHVVFQHDPQLSRTEFFNNHRPAARTVFRRTIDVVAAGQPMTYSATFFSMLISYDTNITHT